MGLKDLQMGRIRTPLEPYQTFMDDPLRILRVVRFAGRFGYAIDEDVINAARNKDVQVK